MAHGQLGVLNNCTGAVKIKTENKKAKHMYMVQHVPQIITAVIRNSNVVASICNRLGPEKKQIHKKGSVVQKVWETLD